MDKKKRAANIYIIILFGILNLVCFDFKLLEINIRTILLFTVTVVMFLYFFALSIRHFKWNKLTRTDWIISAIIIMALGSLVYRVSTSSTDIAQELLVLAIGLMYFILRGSTFDANAVFSIFNLSNCVIYVMLMVTYLTRGWGTVVVQFLTNSGGILAWLVLGVTVSILAYCMSEGKKEKIFYGIGMILGSFFLFMQKNMITILIIEGLLVMLPFTKKPSKSFIKRAMEMFLSYNFLLCNMSLITGYVELFKGYVTYDLEASVYLEMALALAGLGFFTLWDKHTNESDAPDKLLPEILPFFKATAVVMIIFIGALFAAATRGSSVVFPDMMYKFLSLFILSVSGQFGIFYTVGQRYGAAGVAIIFIFFVIIAMFCLKKSEEDKEEQKLLKCIAVIYVAQGIFLRQSVVATPLYMVFVILHMNRIVYRQRDITDGSNVMEITDAADQADATDIMEITDVTDATDQTDVTGTMEITDAADITCVSDVATHEERNIADETDDSDTMLQ